ncbi:DUF4839 domain-containing protein [Streptomyces sp. NPDC002580]|uniref:DUF4839 domain-containing protein n=1 Tax=Streptomyces sp. NPDC002580 TaxID=3364653 RepID=UPI0036C3E173
MGPCHLKNDWTLSLIAGTAAAGGITEELLTARLTGEKTPATVGEGDKFRFVAEVGEYNAASCLFFLEPVSTEIR